MPVKIKTGLSVLLLFNDKLVFLKFKVSIQLPSNSCPAEHSVRGQYHLLVGWTHGKGSGK